MPAATARGAEPVAGLGDTHFQVAADIAALAAAAERLLAEDHDDLGRVQAFTLEQGGVAFEFFRHPDAPNPGIVSVLSAAPGDLRALAAALNALGVPGDRVYTTVTAEAAPVADLNALRSLLGVGAPRAGGDAIGPPAGHA